MHRPRAFHPLDPRTARQRLTYATIIGIVAWFVTPASLALETRLLIAWNVGGLVLLTFALAIILRADVTETRRRAASHDPGRTAVWLIVLGSSTLSLFFAIATSRHTKDLPHLDGAALLALSLFAVALAWLLTHVAFTLRYAHLYYRSGRDGEGGLELPGGEKPDDLDFAYFAFTLGMCFQVSDITITDRTIRHTALAHGMLSFAYNTGILALTVNLVIAQLS
jgi:uncharacterized membrane protein